MRIIGDPEQALKTAVKLWRGWRFRDIGMDDNGQNYIEIDLRESCICEFCGNSELFEVDGYRVKCKGAGCRGVLAAYNPKVNQWKEV